MSNLRNKVAIVTGGSAEVGEAICMALGLAGAKVIVGYLANGKGAENTLKLLLNAGAEATTCKVNLKVEDDAEAIVKLAIKKYGRLDIIVNNARGKITRKPIDEVNWDDFDELVSVILKGSFHISKHAVTHMKKNGGRIINILNNITDRPVTGYTALSSAFASLEGFTKALSVEVGQYGITVNSISPGFTLTSNTPYAPAWVQEKIAQETPMKRLAIPKDIANGVIFLSSDEAGFITGTTLPIDGGF